MTRYQGAGVVAILALMFIHTIRPYDGTIGLIVIVAVLALAIIAVFDGFRRI